MEVSNAALDAEPVKKIKIVKMKYKVDQDTLCSKISFYEITEASTGFLTSAL